MELCPPTYNYLVGAHLVHHAIFTLTIYHIKDPLKPKKAWSKSFAIHFDGIWQDAKGWDKDCHTLGLSKLLLSEFFYRFCRYTPIFLHLFGDFLRIGIPWDKSPLIKPPFGDFFKHRTGKSKNPCCARISWIPEICHELKTPMGFVLNMIKHVC